MTLALRVYRGIGAAGLACRVPQVLLRARPQELRERLGHAPCGGTPSPLWIHAASVGEMAAAGVLVGALRADGHRVALTAMTRTGKERAAAIPVDVGPLHAPIDVAAPVRRFLGNVAPRGLVVLETEIWPGWIHELGLRGLPWGIASARLSDRSVRRARWDGHLLRDALRTAGAIGARTEHDARAFVEAGARGDAVTVTGDLKEDREVPAWEPPPVGPAWIAACTREGEEEIVLDALKRIEERVPRGELWLAPRHPERFAEVAALVERCGCEWRSWDERDRPSTRVGWSVVLVDRMGVLAHAYRRAWVAFVGGSVAPLGGHSPWEAAAAGRAVLLGPHTENCADLANALERAGAASRVRTADDLAAAVERMLTDPEAAQARGRAAHECVAARAGATRRTLDHFRARGLLS